MVITLFGATKMRPGTEEREARLYEKVAAVAKSMPGFISSKVYTAEDGDEVGIIRFDTREAEDAWAHEDQHLAAQAVAAELYEYFWIQVAETYREYTWTNGVHADGDLTSLFSERTSA